MVEDAHQPQQVLGRDRVVHLVVPQEVVRGLDQEQLQHAFDDDLLKDPAPVVQVRLGVDLLAVVRRRRQRSRQDGLPIRVYSRTSEQQARASQDGSTYLPSPEAPETHCGSRRGGSRRTTDGASSS